MATVINKKCFNCHCSGKQILVIGDKDRLYINACDNCKHLISELSFSKLKYKAEIAELKDLGIISMRI